MITRTYYKKWARIMRTGVISCLLPLTSYLFISCSDFLEIEPLNDIVLNNFWNEKADVDGIIAGCYSGMQSDAMIRRMIIWGEARSENIGAGLNSTNDDNLLNVLNENIMATNGYTSWE